MIRAGVIARSPEQCGTTKQPHEIASPRPVHHAVQGFVRNDRIVDQLL